MTRRRPRGFTLIELMIALLISSLLVGMILAIFSRMSIAYRGQQQIAGVQQVLAAARAAIELDAKQAGLEMAQGFKIASDPHGVVRSPVVVRNNPTGTGPDQIAFFYADTSSQAVVTIGGPLTTSLTVDLPTAFAANDLVVLVKVDSAVGQVGLGSNDALIATYDACVLQVATASAANPGPVTFTAGTPWNGDFSHCTVPAVGTMLYKLVAHAYRIDPAKPDVGPLLMSPTGGLLGNVNDGWAPLAFGFTDIQAALRVYDNDAVDADGDGDPTRDWHSGADLTALTTTGVPVALQMSISLVARTDRDVEGISTPQTPELTEAGLVPKPWVACCPRDNNPLGDRPAVILPPAPPWLADPALQGARIYRYTTFQVDFRNMGVGR